MDPTQKRRTVPTQQTHLVQKQLLAPQTNAGLTVNATSRPVTRQAAQTRQQHQQHQQHQQQYHEQQQQQYHEQQHQQQYQQLFHLQPHPQRPTELTPYAQLYMHHAADPQFAFEYCEDIHLTLLEAEQKYMVTSDYMLSQSNLTPKYREVLIDWLSSVRGKYRLKIDTFALCISILDRFLERREITKDKLQLVGCSALWIAAKYEEIYPPELEDLITVCDRNFTREQFIMMERIILTILGFNVTIPYAHHFAERFVQALPNEEYPNKVLIQNISMYIIESSYQHYCFVGHLPSQIASAAVSLALFFTQHKMHFPQVLTQASGYQFTDIEGLFDLLWSNVSNVHASHALKREQQQNGVRPGKVFDSVYRLYMTETWNHAPQYISQYDQAHLPQ